MIPAPLHPPLRDSISEPGRIVDGPYVRWRELLWLLPCWAPVLAAIWWGWR